MKYAQIILVGLIIYLQSGETMEFQGRQQALQHDSKIIKIYDPDHEKNGYAGANILLIHENEIEKIVQTREPPAHPNWIYDFYF